MRIAAVVVGFAVALISTAAWAYPPYRSTDADTADPWTLEARLGLIRLAHEAGQNEYSAPLLRVNLGIPYHIEIVSEFDYMPAEKRVGDAALGMKWIPLIDIISVGTEVLALLPISKEGGAGIEASLLATYRVKEIFQMHVNVGSFYDARSSPAEWGMKVGMIGEFRLGRFRPGAEIFFKRVVGEDAQLLAGPGVIVKLGPIDIRSGIHVGLTPKAADITSSLWVTGALPLADP